jgi:glycosyltransferase involved in cell wall biosynthesis
VSGTPDVYFTIGAPFRWLGRPLVLDQRDLSPELYELRYGRRGRVYRLLRRLERASYRTADHVITVNGTLERTAYERGSLKPGSVTVVGNGPLLARTARRDPRPELREGQRFLCCWLGFMGPQDRVDVALRAIRHLVHVEGRRDCHFAFVGDGEARPDAQRLAEELGIADRVSFPGWVDEETAFGYLSTADIGLEPNLEPIVTPVKGLEYMAFGLPFVAFDLPETRTLAGPAAAYAPPGDEVALAGLVGALLDDPARRAEMGRAGRQRIEERFAWDHQQVAYVEVYRRLLAAPARRRPVQEVTP